MSRPSEPVDTTGRSFAICASPIFMIEPLPNCFSICASAAASALLFWSSMGAVRVALVEAPEYRPAAGRPGRRAILSGADHGIERSFDASPPNGLIARTDGLGATLHDAPPTQAATSPSSADQHRRRPHGRPVAREARVMRASSAAPRLAHAKQTRPTGLSGVPPPGPAMPVTATATWRRCAPARPPPSPAPSPPTPRHARASVAGGTPSSSVLASFE